MDDRYEKLLLEFSDEDRLRLKTYVSEIFEFKNIDEWEQKSEERLKQLLEEATEFEERAKLKIEERKRNPICSFCRVKAEKVEKMFNQTDYLSICSDCVRRCYEQL